jgi:hypothetical protein
MAYFRDNLIAASFTQCALARDAAKDFGAEILTNGIAEILVSVSARRAERKHIATNRKIFVQ